MPRRSTVRYYASRGAYYTQIDGIQNHLATGPDDAPDGPTYQAALRKFTALVCGQRADQAKDENPVGLILARFLTHSKTHRRAATARIKEWAFRNFAAACGEIPVAEFRHRHVYDFIERARAGAGGKKWGAQTCRMLIECLQAAFNWASKPGVDLIGRNPLRGIECPGPQSRGRESLLSAEEHGKLCAAAPPYLRDLLVCLENSGARPSELAAAQARDWDEVLGALVYHQDAVRTEGEHAHKTSKKKERVILFTGPALETLHRLVAASSGGPLFRKRDGKGWTARALTSAFWHLRRKAGVRRGSPYSYRHTFATNWLKVNANIDQLAAVMGNTPAIIRRNYSHLLGDKECLRAALEAVKSSQEQPASLSPKLRVIG